MRFSASISFHESNPFRGSDKQAKMVFLKNLFFVKIFEFKVRNCAARSPNFLTS